MRIVFMGTPEFAVASLRALHESGIQIVGVITAPDSDGGRKGVNTSAVKKYALEHGLHIMQPPKLKNPEFLEQLRSLKADLQVVVAFRMLPEVVWNMPPLGTINLHGSLLPKYRGAAPIHWAVIRGETETGVTTFRLKHEIDTGEIIYQAAIPIGPNETTSEVHDRMMQIGADLIVKTVQDLGAGTATTQPQADIEATHAPKLFTETCKINFDAPTPEVHNFIRGLSAFPGAWTTLHGKTFKILRTIEADQVNGLKPGQIHRDGNQTLYIGTSTHALQVLRLQPEGKRPMETTEFLIGWREALDQFV
jgi:methionyl-tRNA formyltransferase